MEQCLYSVQKALQYVAAEVFVVDNASSDGSIAYLQPAFPFVHFVANEQNIGFGKANNSVINRVKGRYVLFLNPDTLVAEDCFKKCLSFMEDHENAGACGIRMIDGSGNFLPESKRSFPSPLTSLFKLTGLNALFPRSRIFARYRLGHLDEHASHEVDVLSGAFMMVRKDILLQLGGFDEAFYMYGEDIDLSYRIQKAGFRNYYFAGSTIIHFKGESTKKGSLNYVKMFYQAMSIFVKKHYSGRNARIFRSFIHVGIWLRALLSFISNLFTRTGLLFFDALLIFSSFKLVNTLWVRYMRHGFEFANDLVNIALPGFTLIFLISAGLAGIYDNKYKPSKAFYSAFVATVIMLAAYSLLPEKYRFSRGVVLFGGLAALIFITTFRWLLVYFGLVEVPDDTKNRQHTIIIGAEEDFKVAREMLLKAGYDIKNIAHVSPRQELHSIDEVVTQLKPVIATVPLRDLIFCEGFFTFSQIIDSVQRITDDVVVKFHANGSKSIIGSDSKHTSGESVSVEGNFNLSDPYQRRMKRTVDVLLAVLILITFPIQMLIAGFRIVLHACLVLAGNRTWIGYNAQSSGLPLLPKGILPVSGRSRQIRDSFIQEDETIDIWYAKTYDWLHDVKFIFKNYRQLGAK